MQRSNSNPKPTTPTQRTRRGASRHGAALAAAAAALLISGQASQATAGHHEEAQVKCEGVNGCKGQSECATDHSACHGENGCAGKGWVKMSAEECAKAKAAKEAGSK